MRMYKAIDVSKTFRIKNIYTAFGKRYDSTYYFEGEHHNFWEIVTVVDGEIGVTAGSDVFVLKKGQAIIHEPMEFHRLWSEGSTCPKIIIFSFEAENVPEYSSKIFEVDDVLYPEMVLGMIRRNFGAEEYELTDMVEKQGISYQLAVKKLEMYILDTVSQKVEEHSLIKSKAAENYTAIIKVLENNIDKNLLVSEIAKMCNMSEINLKKTFSKYAGMGVMDYLTG